ncbi:autotransporter outer membrane beta-barrel domain-containing protein [Serratia nematodiphila]|uniref:autotransporter outer membrane beta-barrel domain-containing protein n=1 Tax=Serratia marcescens TaxID=615 RepID=UPI0038790EA7
MRQAYRQLSGQVHADIASASVNNSRYVRDTLNGRLRQTQGATDSGEIKQDEQGVWGSLLGNTCTSLHGNYTSADSDNYHLASIPENPMTI